MQTIKSKYINAAHLVQLSDKSQKRDLYNCSLDNTLNSYSVTCYEKDLEKED